MRDPRFPPRSTFWTGLLNQAQAINGAIWLDWLVNQLYLMVRASRCIEIGRRFSPLPSLVADYFASLQPNDVGIPAEILAVLTETFNVQADNAISAQAAWCWGLALGRCAGEVGTARELHALLDSAIQDTIMMEPLLDSVARLMANNHPGVVAAVEQDISLFLKAPSEFILGRKEEGYTRSLAMWKEKPPYEAFDLQMFSHLPVHFPFLMVIDHLRRIDVFAYLSWLDRLQTPQLIEESFQGFEVAEDFDEIIKLLEYAPPVYEEGQSSRWVSMVAPILLETALGHVQALLTPFGRPERDEAAYKKLHDDLVVRLEYLARVLARRADGFKLAAHWLLHLVRIRTQLEPWRALPAVIAMQALVKVFGDIEARAASVIQFIPAPPTLSPDEEKDLSMSGVGRSSGSGTPAIDFLIARLLMKAFRQDAQSFEDERHGLIALLLVRDPGLSINLGSSETVTWRHWLVGGALCGPDIVRVWTQYWSRLEEQRRRTRHIAFTSDSSADEPSLFLCLVAISVLEGRDGLQAEPPMALELWNVVYECVWSAALLYGFEIKAEIWRYLLTVLIGILPRHLDVTAENGTERLSDLFSAFAGDEELITHSAARLFRGGVSAQLLRITLLRASIQLQSILAALEQFPPKGNLYPLTRDYNDVVSTCREILNVSEQASG